MGQMRGKGRSTRWSVQGGALLLVAVVLGTGCEPVGQESSSESIALPPQPEPAFVAQDAGTCLEPEEGCDCEAGEAPADCYLPPVALPGGGAICRAGTRYCRDGVWSACEDLRSFVLEGAGAAYSVGPAACNPCDPACATTADRPTDRDLTPDNSSNVTFEGSRGGLTLRSSGTTSSLPDRDGDGVPDVADDFPDDPTRWSRSGGGIYHTLPFGGPAVISPVDFTTRVTTADVYLLMDTTGSMWGEIANLQDGLTSGTFVAGCPGGVVAAIKCMIPNAWIGVGRHDDYPVSPYGGGSDVVYEHLLDMTPSVSAAQAAVNSMWAGGGADGPESQTQALYAMVTGSGLGDFLSARTDCPAGRWGYPCFRPGTIPIVVLFTDANFHNGPSDADPYPSSLSASCCGTWTCTSWGWWGCLSWSCSSWCSPFSPPKWADVIAALNARGVKTIVVESSGGWGFAQAHGEALCNATGSVDASGTPYVFSISSSGIGLSGAVVDAIWNLANNTRFDVTARAVDNPASPIDERGFVKQISVRGWGPGNCRGAAGATAIQCTPGTVVDFRVTFRNDFVRPTTTPQVFNFEIHVLLDGTVQQRIPVRIVVPPAVPTYPPTGYYQRDYDASAFCTIPPQNVRWGLFDWQVSTPTRTAVRFEVWTRREASQLGVGAPDLTLTVPSLPQRGSVNLSDELRAAGVPDQLPYLRVRAVLVASPDRSSSPVLYRFGLRYDCISGT